MRASVLASLSLPLIGCGSVKSNPDASVHDSDHVIDAAADSRLIDAPMGPTPRLHWEFENTTNNTGSLSGFALITPAGISYVAGKTGMAGSFGAGQYSNVGGMKNVLGSYAKVTVAFWLMEPGTLSSVAVMDDNNRSTSPFGGVQLGFGGTSVSVCVSTTSNAFLGGSCGGFTAPSANAWHHWIVRYDGTGINGGQGGPTEIYVDDSLVHTRANDGANNPVFTASGIPDSVLPRRPGHQGGRRPDLRSGVHGGRAVHADHRRHLQRRDLHAPLNRRGGR